MPNDLPPGTTPDHLSAHYAEPLEFPCRVCGALEAEPPPYDLCRGCTADHAAKRRPDHEDYEDYPHA